MRHEKERLLRLIKKYAVRYGDFTLTSGQKSDYYIDGKLITFHPWGAYLSAKLISKEIQADGVSAVGGMALGAVPLATAVAMLSVSVQDVYNIAAFAIRKETKGHGTQKRIEGYLQPGWRVVLLEDVIGTGGSTLEAIKQIEAVGVEVVKVVALVDRLMGAEERLSMRACPLVSLFTYLDLGAQPQAGRAKEVRNAQNNR